MSFLRNPFLSLLLLLVGLSLPTLADSLSVEVTLEKMPGKVFADVQAQAKGEAQTGPAWGNAPSSVPFYQTFTGTVTADATMTKMAIFSDDGCDVTVDGVKVWSAQNTPQALPDLPNSLHELPVTLSPGSHSVEIDYSNVIYYAADASQGIPPDIDGVTLFQYGPAPKVDVITGDWQPNPRSWDSRSSLRSRPK